MLTTMMKIHVTVLTTCCVLQQCWAINPPPDWSQTFEGTFKIGGKSWWSETRKDYKSRDYKYNGNGKVTYTIAKGQYQGNKELDLNSMNVEDYTTKFGRYHWRLTKPSTNVTLYIKANSIEHGSGYRLSRILQYRSRICRSQKVTQTSEDSVSVKYKTMWYHLKDRSWNHLDTPVHRKCDDHPTLRLRTHYINNRLFEAGEEFEVIGEVQDKPSKIKVRANNGLTKGRYWEMDKNVFEWKNVMVKLGGFSPTACLKGSKKQANGRTGIVLSHKEKSISYAITMNVCQVKVDGVVYRDVNMNNLQPVKIHPTLMLPTGQKTEHDGNTFEVLGEVEGKPLSVRVRAVQTGKRLIFKRKQLMAVKPDSSGACSKLVPGTEAKVLVTFLNPQDPNSQIIKKGTVVTITDAPDWVRNDSRYTEFLQQNVYVKGQGENESYPMFTKYLCSEAGAVGRRRLSAMPIEKLLELCHANRDL